MELSRLGGRIRERREKMGLKQADLANALQISPQAVSKWERGENAPDVVTLGPLARLLNVSVDWLLDTVGARQDAVEATVFASGVLGAYGKSLGLAPSQFAAWANGFHNQITEALLQRDGLPIKYLGDAFLGIFTGAGHAQRAVDAALLARRIVSEELRIGLAAGEVYLGSVGHPDYARPDVMGETVNIAFLTRDWAETHAKSGVAATQSVADALERKPLLGKPKTVEFKGVETASVTIMEIRGEA